MMKRVPIAIAFAVSIVSVALPAVPPEPGLTNAPPGIRHEPVAVAVQGQSISVRAAITGTTDTVKSVTLNYATSKDVAPFKLRMQNVGANSFFCTIPANLIAQASQVMYYIEATDEQGLSSETPWYTVKLRSPEASQQTPPAAPAAQTNEEKSGSWWTSTPVLIGGGAVIAGGAAALLANSGKKSSSGGGSTGGENTGFYAGSVTTTLDMPGSAPATSTHGMTITIATNGTVSSDNLYQQGVPLQGNLMGSDFTLTALVHETNVTGEIRYAGTVLNGRITGSVGGTVTSSSGTNGVYYGSFSALKQ